MDNFLRYVINLPERQDRRSDMEAQLGKIKWQAQFLAAHKPPSADGFPSIGARGCFLSHLHALKLGTKLKRHIIIMEDDLDFVPSFGTLWHEAVEAIQNRDWSIFYPGHTLARKSSGLSMVEPDEGIVCAHFVVIHRDAAPKVIHEFEAILSRSRGHPLGGPMHVDGAYSTIRAQNSQLKTYVFTPSLGHQRSSRSDIANLKLYDRIEMLQPVINRLRRIKSALK